jgi:hypothetical protein
LLATPSALGSMNETFTSGCVGSKSRLSFEKSTAGKASPDAAARERRTHDAIHSSIRARPA